jgi:hypothetical protein
MPRTRLKPEGDESLARFTLVVPIGMKEALDREVSTGGGTLAEVTRRLLSDGLEYRRAKAAGETNALGIMRAVYEMSVSSLAILNVVHVVPNPGVRDNVEAMKGNVRAARPI